jgi:hypothetical protein
MATMLAVSAVYHGFEHDDVCFVLDQRFELDFYSDSSLKQQPVGRHAAPSQPVFAPTH